MIAREIVSAKAVACFLLFLGTFAAFIQAHDLIFGSASGISQSVQGAIATQDLEGQIFRTKLTSGSQAGLTHFSDLGSHHIHVVQFARLDGSVDTLTDVFVLAFY